MTTDVAGGSFQVYRGVDQFLAELGTFSPLVLGVEDLTDAARSVLAVLPFTPHIPNEVFREHFSDDYRFEVETLDARPTRVIDTRAYTRDDAGLAVVDSEWELEVKLLYRYRSVSLSLSAAFSTPASTRPAARRSRRGRRRSVSRSAARSSPRSCPSPSRARTR
jgi:hypothetical protein